MTRVLHNLRERKDAHFVHRRNCVCGSSFLPCAFLRSLPRVQATTYNHPYIITCCQVSLHFKGVMVQSTDAIITEKQTTKAATGCTPSREHAESARTRKSYILLSYSNAQRGGAWREGSQVPELPTQRLSQASIGPATGNCRDGHRGRARWAAGG